MVENTANVAYVLRGETHHVPSNTVVTSLVPLIDVANTATEAQAATLSGGKAGYAYSFIISNPGTAADRYELSAAFTNVTAPIDSLWLDVNHNHLFDTGVDTRLDFAAVPLDAGASIDILVMSETRGTVSLTATSLNDDRSAVVRHRRAEASIGLDIKRVEDELRLTKSQTVDTQGADAPGRGTLITYTLEAHIPAQAAITDAAVTDAIPAGTEYVPGSLSLDSVTISDAADADGGAFDSLSHAIAVDVPAVAANVSTASNHIIRFQVRIN